MASFSKIFPSKKFFWSALISLIVIGGIVWLSIFYKRTHPDSLVRLSDTNSPITLQTPTLENQDTDGDSISDWEEILWGTNPQSLDSDFDGISDADEIEKERTQLLRQISTASSPISLSEATQNILRDESLSQTERLSRVLLTQTLGLQNQGVTIDETTAQNIVQTLAPALFATQNALPTQKVTSAELQLVPTNDENSFRLYANQLGTVLGSFSTTTNELLILGEFAQTQSSDEFNKLSTFGDTYGVLSERLKSIPVPTSLVDVHIGLIQGYAQTGAVVKLLPEIVSDPVAGLFALKQYDTATEALKNVFSTLQKKLSDANVVFTEQDPGYIITTSL